MRVTYPTFDDASPVYANQATVQFLGDEFVLTFYAAFPPVLTGPDDAEKWLQAGELIVPATCVAKIVIARNRMPEILKVLTENAAQARAAEADASSQEPNNG